MENVNPESPALRQVVASGVLADDPFVLLDVGCALGIDPAWRHFGPYLRAHGFDPQVDECERLNAAEANPYVRYHPAFVGLPEDHPYLARRAGREGSQPGYFEPFFRSSAYHALNRKLKIDHETPDAVQSTDHWRDHASAVERIAIDEFVAREGLVSVDFVKIDTDGADLEAAMSCEASIREADILGFMIESWFTGSADPDDNTFHNLDRYMKAQGFLLFGITVNRYSRAALPGTFVYRAPYQTRAGQPMWGDMLYLRDAGSPQYEAVWQTRLTCHKLLKLICLFLLFELPDCAAEVILAHRERLSNAVDPEALLNLLTPSFRGKQVPYADYVAAFDDDVESFYPDEPPPLRSRGY